MTMLYALVLSLIPCQAPDSGLGVTFKEVKGIYSATLNADVQWARQARKSLLADVRQQLLDAARNQHSTIIVTVGDLVRKHGGDRNRPTQVLETYLMLKDELLRSGFDIVYDQTPDRNSTIIVKVWKP